MLKSGKICEFGFFCCFVFQMIKGKVKAGKVDCQAYPQTCQKAGIKAYPSVKLYHYERGKVRAD